MRVRFHADAGELLTAADRFLQSDPFSGNIVAVVAARVTAGNQADDAGNLWATVADADDGVVGIAMQTPPHHLFVSRMPGLAAAALASAVADAGRDLNGVTGAVTTTAAFAEAWTTRTGHASTVRTAMLLYRLAKLVPPPDGEGRATRATAPGDVELVVGWLRAFHDEAQPNTPVEDVAALVRHRMEAGEIHLWRVGPVPVAVAAVSAPAIGVARVGPVYTPPEHRRHGYGAAVTAEATAAALAGGAQHVALYTDLANPTSNSIYQAIGYRPDHDAEERVFF
jgi:predicted GNAT family acetyltransferase